MEGKRLVVPCVYIFRGKQKHLDRLITVFTKLKAWSNNFKPAFLKATTLYKKSLCNSVTTTVAIFQKTLTTGIYTREKYLCKKMGSKEGGRCLLGNGIFSGAYGIYIYIYIYICIYLSGVGLVCSSVCFLTL